MSEGKVKIMQGGNPQRVQKQHAAGKLTVRERLDLLFDLGTFQEYNIFMEYHCHDFEVGKVDTSVEGVVTGYNLINGHGVFVLAHDFIVLGGVMGEIQGTKAKRIQEPVLDIGVSFVGLNDSGDGRVREGPATSYGAIFYNSVMASGVIPQMSVVVGPCTDGTVYFPTLADFAFSVDRTSRSFFTDPPVIKNVTGETMDEETLGDARTHNTLSGVSYYSCKDDVDYIEQIKVLLSYLPPNYRESSSAYPCTDIPDRHCGMLNTSTPDNERKIYDTRDIVLEIADNRDSSERQVMYATSIVAGFIRMNGKFVDVVANQPQSLASHIDISASDKAAWSICTYDRFNIPLLFIVNVPGFLSGTDQEFGGIIRHDTKMLYAWPETIVSKIAVAVGRVIGGTRPAVCSWELHPGITFAWPPVQMIVVDAESVADICRKKELKTAREAGEDMDALRRQYIEEYTRESVSSYKAAESNKLEDIAGPIQSRHIIIHMLEMLRNGRVVPLAHKHDNVPL